MLRWIAPLALIGLLTTEGHATSRLIVPGAPTTGSAKPLLGANGQPLRRRPTTKKLVLPTDAPVASNKPVKIFSGLSERNIADALRRDGDFLGAARHCRGCLVNGSPRSDSTEAMAEQALWISAHTTPVRTLTIAQPRGKHFRAIRMILGTVRNLLVSRSTEEKIAAQHVQDVGDFLHTVMARDSYDDRGGSVNVVLNDHKDANASWQDGFRLLRFTNSARVRTSRALDVTAHELGHGVIRSTANLRYQGESGALNESYADLFGVLTEQWKQLQTADRADWRLLERVALYDASAGAGVDVAPRSMAAPGSPYHDAQPRTYDKRMRGKRDHGGVHVNDGIPNYAFAIAAKAMGGYAWERAGRIWYIALRDRLGPNSNFADAARETIGIAARMYGKGSLEHQSVVEGWRAAGVI